MYSDQKEITDSLLLVSLLMSQLHVVCGKRQKVCVICCVIGCGEELVWICLDRVCVGVTGQFVDEMSLYPGKLAALPVFFCCWWSFYGTTLASHAARRIG